MSCGVCDGVRSGNRSLPLPWVVCSNAAVPHQKECCRDVEVGSVPTCEGVIRFISFPRNHNMLQSKNSLMPTPSPLPTSAVIPLDFVVFFACFSILAFNVRNA